MGLPAISNALLLAGVVQICFCRLIWSRTLRAFSFPCIVVEPTLLTSLAMICGQLPINQANVAKQIFRDIKQAMDKCQPLWAAMKQQ